MTKRANPATARKRIADLTTTLKQHNFLWAADCFEAYLSGNAPSLDAAFGLVGSRGAPRKNATLTRDIEIVRLRCQGESWQSIVAKLGLNDLRDAQRMVAARLRQPTTTADQAFHKRAVAAFSAVLGERLEGIGKNSE